jgi:hypothetical protein
MLINRATGQENDKHIALGDNGSLDERQCV